MKQVGKQSLSGMLLVAALVVSGCAVTARAPGTGPTERVAVRNDRRDAEYERREYEQARQQREMAQRQQEMAREREKERQRAMELERQRERDRHANSRGREPAHKGQASVHVARPGNAQVRVGGYFRESQRVDVHNYYRQHGRRDKCPPGLAKKRNGCDAPGQARKWSMGRPLPRGVAYQPVEAEIRVKLGSPPAGHEFVRVASDILLIAVGSSIVIDAIQDINGR